MAFNESSKFFRIAGALAYSRSTRRSVEYIGAKDFHRHPYLRAQSPVLTAGVAERAGADGAGLAGAHPRRRITSQRARDGAGMGGRFADYIYPK